MDIFAQPYMQALVAGLLTWGAIALGALIILCKKDFSRKAMNLMLGAAGGMMLAASFWSLLAPALELSAHWGKLAFLPPLLGLVLGTGFLMLFDLILPHIHGKEKEGLSTTWKRSVLLVTAMALHHIPEGLAIGVGYGAAGVEQSAMEFSGAVVLTLSIMLQSVPEGLVVATALRAEGLSAKKACFWGVLSGATTPLGTVPGALAAGVTASILPVVLAFAAGAMLYVVVEDVIPEFQASGHGNGPTLALIAGVMLVMTLGALLA